MSKISIYQVFTRLFGVKNAHPKINGGLRENGVGKMNDFTVKALKEIKNLGITHIWYTGIIEHATCENFESHSLMGQHPSIVKGKAGSPYAITDYYDVNPYLAESIPDRVKEFEALIKRTHENDLKVIIDFVPNHVARQYNSDVFPERNFGINDNTELGFSPFNDYYYLPNKELVLQEGMGTKVGITGLGSFVEKPAKATGNDQFHEAPSINDWYETVKLNYGVDYLDYRKTYFDPIPPIWNKMVDILLFWADKKVDGFRCDMAEMVPVEFWNYAIKKIKEKFPQIIFVAEVYNPDLYQDYIDKGRFDYLYDKVGLYDTLRNIMQQDTPANEITKCWQLLDGIDAKMLRFLENHDEQRIASQFFANDPYIAIPAMIISATINTGPIMIYFGQEVGEPAIGESGYGGDDGRTTIFDFYHVPEFQKWYNDGKFTNQKLSQGQIELKDFYRNLLNISISERAISEGRFYDIMWANNFDGGPDITKIYSYLRYYNDEIVLIIVNFDKYNNHEFKLKIPEHALELIKVESGLDVKLLDILGNNNSIEVSSENLYKEGLNILIRPNSGIIYKFSF